jgi:hypothetical protein
MIQRLERTLYSNVTPKAITSSTDDTPIVVTLNAHGFVVGDRVLIYGHATNVAANGIFKVIAATANTFTLGDELTGANVAGSGAGAGSGGIVVIAPPVLLLSGFRNIILQVSTDGTATLNLKAAISAGKPEASSLTSPRYDYPNLGATVTPANPYTLAQIINLATGAAVDGATGIAVAGTDINNSYEVNINAGKYFIVFPATWTQGAFTVKAILESNG